MLRTAWLLGIALCALAHSVSAQSAAIAAAVANSARPEADRARDGDRRPAEVLSFLGIAPGMKVADLAAGGGYYSEILARVVGAEGRVYLQNNAWSYQKFGDMGLPKRLARPGLENVVKWDRELDALGLRAASSMPRCSRSSTTTRCGLTSIAPR